MSANARLQSVDLLRGLAMALTAAGGRVLSIENIHEAFSERSKTLVTSDFVDALLGKDKGAREEIELLIRLAENVTGGANKRQAALPGLRLNAAQVSEDSNSRSSSRHRWDWRDRRADSNDRLLCILLRKG